MVDDNYRYAPVSSMSDAALRIGIPKYAEMRANILRHIPPSGQRPQFDVVRHWSNPSLQDPARIIANVLAKPTIEDLARTIAAYGPDQILERLSAMIEEGDLAEARWAYTKHLVQLAIEGVADAASELASR